MFGTLRNLLTDEGGATAIEYGLIAALVSVAIIVVPWAYLEFGGKKRG